MIFRHTARFFSLLILLLASLSYSVLASAAAEERWDALKPAYFGDRPISEEPGIVSIEAPMRAHDAATVPIVVRSTDPNRRLVKVHLIADQNPLPLAGVFKFSEEAGNWTSFETRIRIDQYTNVRAIAELADGSLHMASSFVKAAGGCSAPAMADLQAAISNAGKMKVLLGKAAESETASSAEAIIKISHPNNSGMQFDQVSRNYIPAFYIDKIGAEVNGRLLLDVETNFSLSENPVIRLNYPADADHAEITVFATDSKGNRYEQAANIDGGTVTLETPTTTVQ